MPIDSIDGNYYFDQRCGLAKQATPSDEATPESLALGLRIRTLVEAIGLQSRAAEIAQMTPQHLRNLMTGRATPSLLAVARLADAAKMSLAWAITGDGDPKRRAPSMEPLLSDLSRKLNIPATREGLAVAQQTATTLSVLSRGQRLRRLSELIDPLEQAYASAGLPLDDDESVAAGEAMIDLVGDVDDATWGYLIPVLAGAHQAALEYATRRLRG